MISPSAARVRLLIIASVSALIAMLPLLDVICSDVPAPPAVTELPRLDRTILPGAVIRLATRIALDHDIDISGICGGGYFKVSRRTQPNIIAIGGRTVRNGEVSIACPGDMVFVSPSPLLTLETRSAVDAERVAIRMP